MSSPSSAGGNNASVAIREGTRFILREITANLQNSPPSQSPRRKNGNEATPVKGDQQHDVKVTFIREFADAGASPGREANTESSLSSASSFQSLTSTFSSKCSSGICVDSNSAKVSDTSYVSADIPGLDDLISGCENIRLTDKTLDLSKDQSFKLNLDDAEDLNISGDQTFSSAVDNRDSPNGTLELSTSDSPAKITPDNSKNLDSTCVLDEQTEKSPASDFFECATVDVVEATRFQQANFELDSATENSVNCVSDIAQVDDKAGLNENTQDNRQELEIPEIEEAQESSEIIVKNNEENLQVHKIDSVGTLTPPINEFDGNSTVTLEPPLNLSREDSAVQSKEIPRLEKSVQNEVAEDVTQSAFDVTADVSSHFQDIDNIELSNFGHKEVIPVGTLHDLVGDVISNVDSLKCYEPTTTLSELNENFNGPYLPTLSSVCLPSTLADDQVPLAEQHDTTETVIPEVPVSPTLSEKFDNVAANYILPINSISTIQEPTFLNAQKLVEESVELKKHEEAVEDTIPTVENIEENTNSIVAKQVENLNEPSHIEFSDFKKPEPPANRAADTTVVLSQQRETEAEETEAEIGVEKQEIPEIVDNPELNTSTDPNDLNDTVTIQDISAENIFPVSESDQYAEFLPQQQSTSLTLERAPPVNFNNSGLISGDNFVSKAIPVPDEYAAFKPEQQSTTLDNFIRRPLDKLERQPTPFVTVGSTPADIKLNGHDNKSPTPNLPVDNRCNFEKLELEAKAVANDIYNTSLTLEEDLFHDPGGFDFLLSKTPRKNTRRDLRAESLYVKFDPLVSNTTMLPQGNTQNSSPPVKEARNGDNDTTIVNVGTPKRNPAIAAIDRLLFYSPMTTTTTPATNTAIQKTNDSQEKTEPIEETSVETVNMAKELELVRSTVIQLEEQVEKLSTEALEKQSSYQEKINQLQTQLAQAIKDKNQITVVVDEYEKSISRLVAERERDRKNLDLEKAKLQEELVAAKHHLDNTESAFNDVHLKYERLKAVVSTYKSNEIALKQSIQENVEIIKSLENRYEQVKEHATARLEKANQDLDAIRKQNDSETVRLHAMLRKAELKSNSLAELVEQKTKENKELTQILDEVIARVGRNKSE